MSLTYQQAKAAKPKGLAGSRFADADDGNNGTAANDEAAEGEDDDYSSAALATVREPPACRGRP